MNKYDQLRAAIAVVRKVNKGLLRVLPQWSAIRSLEGERLQRVWRGSIAANSDAASANRIG